MAMLKFLGLVAQPAFTPKLGFFDPKLVRVDGDMAVKHPPGSSQHMWAIGAEEMCTGTYAWGCKILRLSEMWMLLGIISSTSRQDGGTYNDKTCFGWAGGAQVWKKGVDHFSHGGWTGFNQGDTVSLQLDADAGKLRMKVDRIADKIFELDVDRRPYRIHVNLAGESDHVELLVVDSF
mmetsp:Transcript_21092/g.58940  ORF Transcript_21092/g.58940 Transcript_21092/m.58940 type:complete len:178 (-) Transcript_21092:253-786(-)